MFMKSAGSLAGLVLAAVLATSAIPQLAQALTPEQSAALTAADEDGREALASELAAQALVSPADWRDLLNAAITLDPESTALLAATLAAVIPVAATDIALEAGGQDDVFVCALVATMVPAAYRELYAACGPFDDADAAALNDLALLARKSAASGRQLAAVLEPNTRVTIQNGRSELRDVGTPSPN